MLSAQEIEAELGSGTSHERKLSLFDKLFFTYHEAKRHIREDTVGLENRKLCLELWLNPFSHRLSAMGILPKQVTAGDAEDVKSQLASLDRAVSSILLEKTLERNLLLVQLARGRLERQQNKSDGQKDEKMEKVAKPEDLVRLYDILSQVQILHSCLHLSGWRLPTIIDTLDPPFAERF